MSFDEKARNAAIGAFAKHMWETCMQIPSINPETMEKALEAYEAAKAPATGQSYKVGQHICPRCNTSWDVPVMTCPVCNNDIRVTHQPVEKPYWKTGRPGFNRGVQQPGEFPIAESFQKRVHPWMMECFGSEIASDKTERNHRFIEEALELVQSCGTAASECHQLVDYVFGRPVGEPYQESGGVMVTHAALCLANGLDMHENGEIELARIWTKVEKIRAKQASKPKHSPLPQVTEPIDATEEAKLKFLARQLATAAYDYLENPALPLIAFVDNCWMQYSNQAKYALPLLQLPMRESRRPTDEEEKEAVKIMLAAMDKVKWNVASKSFATAALESLLERFDIRRRE